MKKYLVKKCFGPTIQGEATYSGLPVKFLRFSGCNRWTGRAEDKAKAACWFCDTDFANGTLQSIDEILHELAILGMVDNLVLSGGEPTLQIDEPLLRALVNDGYKLHLETNGSKNIDHLTSFFTHITMSPKQPIEQTKLSFCDDLKLLFPKAIPGVTPELFENFPCKQKWLQPVDEGKATTNTENAINYILNNPGWRLSVQTHKIIGVE